jgi:hypothetical protein
VSSCTDPGRPMLNRYGRQAPPGPWWDEPDQVDWTDLTGIECRARRGPVGAWCGYVGVRPGHPLHGQDYDDLDVTVHGGLTFAGPHVSGPPDVWWFGFDCAHAGDYAPGMVADGFTAFPGEVYRDLPYVLAEIMGLAEQVGRVTPRGLLGWVRYP